MNGHEVESIKTILSSVGNIEGPFTDLPESEQYVIYLGYIERGIPCGCRLGDGYGDPVFFPTREKAKEYYDKWKPQQGKEIPNGSVELPNVEKGNLI